MTWLYRSAIAVFDRLWNAWYSRDTDHCGHCSIDNRSDQDFQIAFKPNSLANEIEQSSKLAKQPNGQSVGLNRATTPASQRVIAQRPGLAARCFC